MADQTLGGLHGIFSCHNGACGDWVNSDLASIWRLYLGTVWRCVVVGIMEQLDYWWRGGNRSQSTDGPSDC